MHGQKGKKNGAGSMAIGDKIADPPLELPADSPWKEHATILQHGTHLVFEIAPDPYQPGLPDKDGPCGLAFLAFDVDLPLPSDPDEFRQAQRIILVALVHTDGQCRRGVASNDADHWRSEQRCVGKEGDGT